MDLQGEKNLLARILCDYRILNEIRIKRMLSTKDFSILPHRIIFSAMCDVVEEGKRLDVVTVVEKLRANGTLEESGGIQYLASLLESIGPDDDAPPLTVKDLKGASDEFDIAWENFAVLFPGSARNPGNSVKGPVFESILSSMKTTPADNPFSTIIKNNQPRNLRHHLQDMNQLLHSESVGPEQIKVTLTELAITPGSCVGRKEEFQRQRYERAEAERLAWQERNEKRVRSEHQKEITDSQEQKRAREIERLGPTLEGLCKAVVSILDTRSSSEQQVDALTKSVRQMYYLTRKDGGYPMEDAVKAFLTLIKENERLYAKRSFHPEDEGKTSPDSALH